MISPHDTMNTVELIQPLQQRAWGKPVASSLFFGGAAAGFYLLSLITGLHASDRVLSSILAACLAGLGFISVALEDGHPYRGIYFLNNLRNSWMSVEALAGGGFIVFALAGLFLPVTPVFWLTAATGATYLTGQGMVVYRAIAVTAWNISLVPFLIVTSGLVSGLGILFLVAAVLGRSLDAAVMGIGICIIGTDLLTLVAFSWWKGDTFRQATRVLRRPGTLFVTVGIGHVVPALMLVLLAVQNADQYTVFARVLAVFSGLCIVIGTKAMKSDLILRTGYLRGVVMSKGQVRTGRPV